MVIIRVSYGCHILLHLKLIKLSVGERLMITLLSFVTVFFISIFKLFFKCN